MITQQTNQTAAHYNRSIKQINDYIAKEEYSKALSDIIGHLNLLYSHTSTLREMALLFPLSSEDQVARMFMKLADITDGARAIEESATPLMNRDPISAVYFENKTTSINTQIGIVERHLNKAFAAIH